MREVKKNEGKGKPSTRLEAADRMTLDVSHDITPTSVERIMQQANMGDSRQQYRLAVEMLEKNDSIRQAMETRRNAVMGCSWSIQPGGEGKREEEAARRLQAELDACGDGDERDGFEDLLEDLMMAVHYGYTVSEILWVNGGEIAGFHTLPGAAIHFLDGFLPRLVTHETPQGMALPRDRYIFSRLRQGHDPVRGGLIRPLAWLHCFKHVNSKDMLSFVERYGMPFVVARVDQSALEQDWATMQRLIRSFGPSGGGVVSHNVETQLLESASKGEVYFELLAYLGAAVEKLVLGQTAASGESAGLSKGDAQSKVRQDILEADCRRISRAVDLQVCLPWCRFNYGPDLAAPYLQIDYEAPEDRLALAQTVQTLAGAGLMADVEEMSERFGMKLTRQETPAAQSPWLAMGAEKPAEPKPVEEPKLAPALREWLSPAAKFLERLAGDDLSDAEFERELSQMRAVEAEELFGDSELFERALEEHIAENMALGAAEAWRKVKKVK